MNLAKELLELAKTLPGEDAVNRPADPRVVANALEKIRGWRKDILDPNRDQSAATHELADCLGAAINKLASPANTLHPGKEPFFAGLDLVKAARLASRPNQYWIK